MDKYAEKVRQLIQADMKADRLLERLEAVDTLTEIIHKGRVEDARSSEIAHAIVKFLKEG